MVKTLFLHRDLPFHGGVAKSFLTYARYRDRRAVEMTVACCKTPTPEMVELLAQDGVATCHIGDEGYLAPGAALRRLVLEGEVQVVVCASFKSFLLAKLASLATPCRVVFWVPSVYIFGGSALKRQLYRLLAARDTLLFISQAVLRYHHYPLHRGKRAVLYHGVEDPLLSEELTPCHRAQRAHWGIPADALVVGYIAEFTACKDHRALLSAFCELAQRRSDLHLVLIGVGELFDAVRGEAALLPHAQRIHFLGSRKDARRLMGIMDIYAHSCRGEGFGLAVVEAMLACLPVVVSDDGALPELVRHEESGLLFRAGDPCDLAVQMERVVEDRDLRRRLGARGRACCLEAFSPATFAAAMDAHLKEEVAR